MTYKNKFIEFNKNGILKYKILNLPDPYKDEKFLKCITDNKNITDDIMNESRKYLYRPNLKVHLKNKKIT